MIAARFRLVGWVAGCAGAALLCYMASQSVAAERSALAKVDGQIASTRMEIARLETEVTARSRAGQLERWNNVLALQAARPGQYASSDIQLASLAGPAGGRSLPLDPAIVASHGAVTNVSYQPAAPAAPVAPSAPAEHAPSPATASALSSPSAAPKPIVPKALLPGLVPGLHAVADRRPAREPSLLHDASYVRAKVGRLDDVTADLLATSYEKPLAAKPAAAKPAAARTTVVSRSATIAGAGAGGATAEPAPARPAKADPHHEAALLPADFGKLVAAEHKAKPAKRS